MAGKNIPSIPGACATRNFVCLVQGSRVRSTVIDLCVCSLAPMRRGCHPELDNFKLISKIYILRISERSFPHVNAIRPCLWSVNNGPDTGLMSSDTKPLPEPMLTQFYVAASAATEYLWGRITWIVHFFLNDALSWYYVSYHSTVKL